MRSLKILILILVPILILSAQSRECSARRVKKYTTPSDIQMSMCNSNRECREMKESCIRSECKEGYGKSVRGAVKIDPRKFIDAQNTSDQCEDVCFFEAFETIILPNCKMMECASSQCGFIEDFCGYYVDCGGCSEGDYCVSNKCMPNDCEIPVHYCDGSKVMMKTVDCLKQPLDGMPAEEVKDCSKIYTKAFKPICKEGKCTLDCKPKTQENQGDTACNANMKYRYECKEVNGQLIEYYIGFCQ